jgi:hypothetical protein
MPIASTDLLFKYSTKIGAAGNTTAGTAAGSLGKYISTTPLQDAVLDNLFDDVTGDENAAGDVEYRCFFIHNNHGSLTLQRAVVWISSEVAGGANTAIGLDPAGINVLGDSDPQAATIATEQDPPTGVAFSAPASKATALEIGDIPAGSVAAIWVRRTATNSAAQNNDGVTIRVEGDTAA